MTEAIRFSTYGDSHVLEVLDVEERLAGPGEVSVAVVDAGLNPGEIAIRDGSMREKFPAKFPSGQGSDFAGVVVSLGEGVDAFEIGDEVIGMSDERSAQAQRVTIAADRLVPKPKALAWEVAGSLYVAATTARACIDAVRPQPGETVVVAGAAGGVGILVTQLAMRAGARVIATASLDNAVTLLEMGATPVEYGDGMIDRIRALAPDGVDAFVDTHGHGNVAAAVELGVDPDRINSITDFAGAARLHAKTDGMATVADPAAVVAETAQLLADGELVLPIRARFPMDRVREAYDELAAGHGLGKIVLHVGAAG
jgi:NADPH:quinone reductase-like Zn-dependent oxidoreductase